MLYPSDGELLDEDMHVWANLTTSRHSEMMEVVDSGERAPVLVFLPLDCVGEVFSCMACCMCVCVCVGVFIKLHITAQSGLVILVILWCVCVCVCVCVYGVRNPAL